MDQLIEIHTNPKGSAWYLGLVWLVASFGGFLFGFDNAVVSGTVGMVELQFALTKLQTGFFIFASICFIATIIFWKFVPETKNKSLEEIEQLWEK